MATAYQLILQGSQENPANASTASGLGTVIFDDLTSSLYYTITIAGLDFGDLLDGGADETAPVADNVVDMHFHNAARGVNGPVVFHFLNQDMDDFTHIENADGTRTFSGRWETTDPSSTIASFAAALDSTAIGSDAALYANIHTNTFPGGEIRGQFVAISNNVANSIFGTAGNDVLPGLGGDDTIFGSQGSDEIDGGSGTDTVNYSASAAGVQVRLTTGQGLDGDAEGDTYVSIENVTGSSHEDVIVGSNGVANILLGGGEADLILGRSGADQLFGEDGADTLDGGADADLLDGGSNFDTVTYTSSTTGVQARLSTGAGLGGDAQGDTYVDIESLTGSNFDDVLVGDGDVNQLNGIGGADILLGRAGADTLLGGLGDDLLDGGTQGDVLNGQGGTDTVSFAGSTAGVQARLTTGAGLGGDAQDDLYISIENLLGSAFNDTLVGSNGVGNKLDGGNGNDTMIGNSGNDILTGGLGKDTLLGGLNNDAFVFASAADSAVGAQRDVIYDFEDAGENDSIVLTGFAGVLSFIGTAAFSAANQVRAIQSGADVLVQINTTGTSGAESEILLANTALAQIDASDFFL